MLPGVYCGSVEFVHKAPTCAEMGKIYLGVMSIGWNPHFDNKSKTIVIKTKYPNRKYTLIISLMKIFMALFLK